VIDARTPQLDDTTPPARKDRLNKRASRIRLLACGALLVAVPFATAPGDIISDTKFELAVNPAGFLSSALTLWDPQQFGGLLNQAVGYLFPMGPFFEVLRLLAVSGWVVQRLWISALLVAAFAGTCVLAGRLNIGGQLSRPVAGLAYAASPAALAIIGQISAEYLPMAVLPWILIPLTGSRAWADGTPRTLRARQAARSAVAVALCSGMNAASAIAVLVPVVIFILTRPAGRRRMLAWWVPAVVLATLSWTIPLVLLGKYGVSTVPYTESAQVTSASTSLLNVLRGTENWVSYLVASGEEWRPLAFQLSTDLVPGVLLGLLAALGLAGLVRRDIPEHRFLRWSVILGVLVISLGYVSSLGNPLEGPLVALINGPGSPFRNLWKFDPMIRLPLALGLAHLLAAERRLKLVAVATTAAFAGLLVPGFATGIASAGSFAQVPQYWVQAAGWLTANAGHQAVLVEPGAPFGQYLWGSPMDDVLQALTSVDYAERDLDTVGSAGNERLLNAIDQQLAAGDGSAGLTQVLARMGVKYVVVRNDLDRQVLSGAWPARVADALAGSPGITEVAQFGPQITGGGPDDAVTNFDAPYPAVRIYQVQGAQPVATVQDAAGTLRVYGAPESLLTLAGDGLLQNRPVLLNDDGAGQPTAAGIDTDSLRRRAVNFGQLRTNFSPTLTATQPADTFLSADDFTEPGWSKYQAIAQYTGIENITASSSSADLGALPSEWATGTEPYSAVDGDLRTMWESGSWDGPAGQWIQEDFDDPVSPGTIEVAFADNAAIGPPVTQVMVTTAAGRVSDPVQVTGNPQSLRLPRGATSWLRITVTGLAYQPDPAIGSEVGIAGIAVPGVSASRTILAPPVPGGNPSAVVLSKAQPYTPGCMLTSLRWVCSSALSTLTEEQYGFNQGFKDLYSERASLHGTAILTDPSLVDKYARYARTHEPTAGASSTYLAVPQDQPRSAFDGNPATAWVASPSDPDPKLTISWGYGKTISQVTIQRPPGAAAATEVLITGSAGQRRGAVIGSGGLVRFARMKTTSLAFTFTPIQAPLQISDVVIPGVSFIGTPTGPFALPCGFGPELAVNGTVVPTRVSGVFANELTQGPLEFTACSPVTLPAGGSNVTEPVTDAFSVQDVVVDGAALSTASAGPAPVAADIQSWGSSTRKLRVSAPVRSFLVVNQNFNLGWRAVIDGRRLEPVQLDGWKQAWVLPAGTTGTVTLTYAPQALYRDAVIAGLAILALLILVAFGIFAAGSRRRRAPEESSGALQPGAPQPPLTPRQDRPWWQRSWWLRWFRQHLRRPWVRLALACVPLAGAGLLLGGYPGAVLLPVATLLFAAPARRLRILSTPWVPAGLLAAAAVAGAVGEHLQLSGDSGAVVSAPANAIPQVICLIVIAGVVAALLRKDEPCAA
jgi:arabinofuranan 3-O-arabinosyltransferase